MTELSNAQPTVEVWPHVRLISTERRMYTDEGSQHQLDPFALPASRPPASSNLFDDPTVRLSLSRFKEVRRALIVQLFDPLYGQTRLAKPDVFGLNAHFALPPSSSGQSDTHFDALHHDIPVDNAHRRPSYSSDDCEDIHSAVSERASSIVAETVEEEMLMLALLERKPAQGH